MLAYTVMNISPQTRIGWVGTGVMGGPMCSHLLERAFAVTVHNRTRAKAKLLTDRGATWVDSPKAVAERSDVVFTMVGFPDDVRQSYLAETGVLAGTRPGSILVDMTTTQPALAIEIAQAAQVKEATALDAPVSGGDVGARNGTLSIMVGGDRGAFEAVRSLFEAMGKSIVYQGPAGSGQHTKMCNQIVISGTMIGVCESLLYGFKAGLNLPTMLQSISGGAAGCWTLTNLAPRIIQRNFDPGFFVQHFIKDMGIALDEAKRMGLSLPGLALAHQLYMAVQAQGHGRCGTHALMLALEQMSNTVMTETKSREC
jgi:3-hydroxyisobutyrate dehydrogenase